MRTIFILASSKKEAIQLSKQYTNPKYIGVHKRCSKGNTFYQFTAQ